MNPIAYIGMLLRTELARDISLLITFTLTDAQHAQRVERIVRRRHVRSRRLLERHFQCNSITMLQRAYSA